VVMPVAPIADVLHTRAAWGLCCGPDGQKNNCSPQVNRRHLVLVEPLFNACLSIP
jgi:hypothetical protein